MTAAPVLRWFIRRIYSGHGMFLGFQAVAKNTATGAEQRTGPTRPTPELVRSWVRANYEDGARFPQTLTGESSARVFERLTDTKLAPL